MTDAIFTVQRGTVYEITLNNPDEGNAATDPMTVELTRALIDAPADADLIVLQGAGDDFCAGRSQKERFAMPADALGSRGVSDAVFDCYGAFRRVRQPIVGVVRGRALGFGASLASLCDITIAAASARFAIPEMGHNRMPTMVMSSLVDRVPRKALNYLVWSTAPISAERALLWGLISEVVPDDELNGFVEDLLATMLKAPKPALMGVKEFSKVAYDMPLPAAVDFARNLHATINTSIISRLK